MRYREVNCTQPEALLTITFPHLRVIFFACAAAYSALSVSVHAQDNSVASRIARVTVYSGSATVERIAKVPAGARSITLDCLPASLDAQSLQINADAGVRVGEFNVRTQDRDVVTACASPLDGRIREMEDQIASIKADMESLQLVESYLKTVAVAGAAEGANGRLQPLTPAQITSTAEVLRKSAQDTHTRSNQLLRKQEALELALKPLVAERERTAGQRAQVVSVSVTLATEHEAELRLSYQVRGTGWQPTYRATLDATKATVVLERQALVAQNSGEDWRNVELTLSTGQPGRATQGRFPRPWTLDVVQPVKPTNAAANYGTFAAPPAPAPAISLMAQKRANAEEALPSFDVSSVDKGFSTEFSVPQRITVPSNGQRITLALGAHAAPVTLLTRVAPAVEEAAYLVAELAPPPGVWPVGSANLYRDGAFVGTGRIDFASATNAASKSSLAFGRDELVTVRALPPQDLTASAGFTGSRTERRSRHAYTVENRHKTAITLQVLHAAPVSRNEKIEIESRYQPQLTDLIWNNNPGTVAWQQPLAAGATAQFSAEHTIRYSKDIEVQERQ